MKLPCFKRKGIFYIPHNLVGWFIMATGMIYLVYRFFEIDSKSHSASDTLRPFIINMFIIFVVYTIIALLLNYGLKKNGKSNTAD